MGKEAERVERKRKGCKDYIFLGDLMESFPWGLLSPVGGGGKGERGKGERGKGKGSQRGGRDRKIT